MKKAMTGWILALSLVFSALPAAAADAPVEEPQAGEYDPMAGADDSIPAAPRLSDGVQGSGEIADPDKYWAQNGYPDDVAYAYEAGGEVREENGREVIYSYWEIGVVGADSARRQEIAGQLAPTCLVTFIDCRYPYAEREETAKQLLALDDPNILQVTLVLNTDKVLVLVAPDMAEQYAASLTEAYGDMVEVTDQPIAVGQLDGGREDSLWQALPQPGLSGGLEETGQPAPRAAFWPFAALAVCLLAALAAGTRRVLLLQTDKGGLHSSPARPGRRRVEQAVRAAQVSPRDAVWHNIAQEIRKK